MRSGAEIESALRAFVKRWSKYAGSERAEAQTFLNELFAASKTLYERRTELCIEHNMGLTKLYNLMDDGGFQDLKKLHRILDEAVASAYGWPKSAAQDADKIVKRLRDLYHQITDGKVPYTPFN